MSGLVTRLAFLSLCGLSSHLWSSNTLSRYAVLDDPETTCLLACLLAAVAIRLTSLYIDRLPSSRGRFHEYSALKADSTTSLPHGIPRRPLAYHPQLFFLLLILRFSIFHTVNKSQQCAGNGLESWVCVLVGVYDLAFNNAKTITENDEPEDMWASVWDDITAWLRSARVTGFVTVVVIAFAANVATSQVIPTTYFCSTVIDSASWIMTLQVIGIVLDMILTVLIWRILWWANTTRSRLRILSDALFVTALGCALMILPSKYSSSATPYIVSPGIVMHDGFVLAIWLVSFSHMVCEMSLVIAPTLVVAAIGITASLHNMMKLGSWLQITRWVSIGPLVLILIALFLTAASMEYSQLGIRSRFLIYLILVGSLVASVVASLLFNTDPFTMHPIKRLIYDRRIENDRWLTHAYESKSLRVAIKEYKIRYNRSPPPGFDNWFTWAIEHNSVVMDAYNQISQDLAPFWRISPAELRKRTEELGGDPDVALINIKGNSVAIKLPEGAKIPKLDELASVISEFAAHLPEMTFAVNLVDHPRILPTGSERISSQDLRSTKPGVETVDLIPGTSSAAVQPTNRDGGDNVFHFPFEWQLVEAAYFRRLFADSCPISSPAAQDPQYTLSSHCRSCEHNHGQIWGMFPTTNWDAASNVCQQPDLMHLHSFFSYPPTSHRVYTKLMPLFGKSKTEPFGDILLPFDETLPTDFDSEQPFDGRKNSIYWRGYFTEATVQQSVIASPLGNEQAAHEQAFRGDLQHRLVHLVNNASADQDVTVILPKGDDSAEGREFEYSHVKAQLMNKVLPFDVAFADGPPLCQDEATDCSRAFKEFGTRKADFPLDHQYVLLPDNPISPAQETLRTLASESVPVISTMFRQWWSERVMPWVHFIPLDPRLTALHSTMSYFTGVSIPPKEHYQNGEEVSEEERRKAEVLYGKRRISMAGVMEDGRWVATQGKSWVKKALRREDRGIYLFRLLLEWGRLVSEDRETMVLKLNEKDV